MDDPNRTIKLSGREALLIVLREMDIAIIAETDHDIQTFGGFSIEIEGPHLYKLLHEGDVIAPFHDVVEMCEFIKTNS